MVRNAIESLYKGICSVFEYASVKNEVTKITKKEEVEVITNRACRVSFKNINSTNQLASAAIVSQQIKLFISPDIIIKPGSKIVVTQNNVTTDYKSSGEPAMYTNHQEIILELFDGWA